MCALSVMLNSAKLCKFDGIAIENKTIPNVEIYVAHFEGLRRISSEYLRDGNVDIAHATWKYSPVASLTAYGYFLAMPLNGFTYPTTGVTFTNNSSRTLGLRMEGNHKINDDWKILYTAEYAKQDDYRDGDNRIDAHYWRLGSGVGSANWSVRLDREILSSNNRLYGFQTPLATGHLFQGLADSFLTTPKDGIIDTFLTLNGEMLDLQLSAEYHWLHSDKDFSVAGSAPNNNTFGKELDLVAGYNFNKRWMGKLEYFHFQEDDLYGSIIASSRKRDTNKFLTTVMYTF